jgi:septal ring factor EnvC (AmiA/AmiB activator)
MLLRAAYTVGQDAPLKAFLSQDRLDEAQRTLAYHRYLQRDRAARIREITAQLTELDTLEQQITQRRTALDDARRTQRQQLASLEAARRDRANLVSQLDRRYQDRAGR